MPRSSTAATRASLEFIAFWLADGRVVAGMNVNIWDVNDQVQELIRSRREVDLARLADPSIALVGGVMEPDGGSAAGSSTSTGRSR